MRDCERRGDHGVRCSVLTGFATVAVILLPLSLATADDDLGTRLIATGMNRPVTATAAPGDDSRLFIGEQHTGAIRILDLDTGQLAPDPFLQLPSVSTGWEQGLLGLAFHPDYEQNGHFFVNFTDAGGDTQVRRYTVDPINPNLADPDSAQTVLSIEQPFSNHNGGWIGFNPDTTGSAAQHLYISTGDGGGSNDPQDAGQSLDTLLGKMLRVDVDNDDFPGDTDRNYAIPTSNPFVGESGEDEIWAYGLRNPWRASFDRATGDLWIADVGQASREEVNFQPASSTGGENYGWRLREGTIATPTGGVGGPRPEDNVDPIHEYLWGSGPDEGQTIIGGYVYRGPVTELQGLYLFADHIHPRLWALDPDDLSVVSLLDDLAPSEGTLEDITAFAEDDLGNVYILTLHGDVFKIVPEPGTVGLIALGSLILLRRNRTR